MRPYHLHIVAMTRRTLTDAERSLVRSIFGDAIDMDRAAVNHGRWWWFQPRDVVMAPDGEIWCHPNGTSWRTCFASGSLAMQGLFIHEMTHVWQHQQGIFLPIARHPFCRYDYRLQPGRPFRRYGIEQQAEIVKHVFLLRAGAVVPHAPPLPLLEALLPF